MSCISMWHTRHNVPDFSWAYVMRLWVMTSSVTGCDKYVRRYWCQYTFNSGGEYQMASNSSKYESLITINCINCCAIYCKHLLHIAIWNVYYIAVPTLYYSIDQVNATLSHYHRNEVRLITLGQFTFSFNKWCVADAQRENRNHQCTIFC